MPVDRGVLIQGVGHRQPDILTFAQPQQRRGKDTVHRHRMARASADREGRMADGQVDVRTCQCGQIGPQTRRPGLRPGRQQSLQAEQAAAGDGAPEKHSAIETRRRHRREAPWPAIQPFVQIRIPSAHPLRQDATGIEVAALCTLPSRSGQAPLRGTCARTSDSFLRARAIRVSTAFGVMRRMEAISA